MRVRRTIEPPSERSNPTLARRCPARARAPGARYAGPGRTLASAPPALRLARHAAGPGIPALFTGRVTPPRTRIPALRARVLCRAKRHCAARAILQIPAHPAEPLHSTPVQATRDRSRLIRAGVNPTRGEG